LAPSAPQVPAGPTKQTIKTESRAAAATTKRKGARKTRGGRSAEGAGGGAEGDEFGNIVALGAGCGDGVAGARHAVGQSRDKGRGRFVVESGSNEV